MVQLENENGQAINVEPVTVEKVLVAPEEATSILVIGTLEIVVAGDPPQVAKVIGDARGYDCPYEAPKELEPPPRALPAGDAGEAPAPTEAPPELAPAGDQGEHQAEAPPAAPAADTSAPPAHDLEPERRAGKGKGKNRPAWQ